jgi:predicted enzyme related to lactoylglutathione lyase
MAESKQAAGTFSWFECGSTDAAKSKSFYTQLFGWNAADVPMGPGGTYTLFKSGDRDIAGLYQLSGPQFQGVPSHWMTYVAVDDVDGAARRAGTLGGKVMAEPMDIPGVGRMAVLKDPTDAVIAVSRFDQHPGTSPEGPFGWSELATRDTSRAQAFYTELFGWTAKPDPKNQYTEFQNGGRSIAGMMEMKPEHGGAPPHWMPYVMVQDCDQTAREVTELGGTMYVPPMDIENVGRFAVFADPAGATLAVIQLKQR